MDPGLPKLSEDNADLLQDEAAALPVTGAGRVGNRNLQAVPQATSIATGAPGQGDIGSSSQREPVEGNPAVRRQPGALKRNRTTLEQQPRALKRNRTTLEQQPIALQQQQHRPQGAADGGPAVGGNTGAPGVKRKASGRSSGFSFFRLVPSLKRQLPREQAGELEASFQTFKKNQITREDIFKACRSIAGDHILLETMQAGFAGRDRRQQQLHANRIPQQREAVISQSAFAEARPSSYHEFFCQVYAEVKAEPESPDSVSDDSDAVDSGLVNNSMCGSVAAEAGYGGNWNPQAVPQATPIASGGPPAATNQQQQLLHPYQIHQQQKAVMQVPVVSQSASPIRQQSHRQPQLLQSDQGRVTLLSEHNCNPLPTIPLRPALNTSEGLTSDSEKPLQTQQQLPQVKAEPQTPQSQQYRRPRSSLHQQRIQTRQVELPGSTQVQHSGSPGRQTVQAQVGNRSPSSSTSSLGGSCG